jgi:glyoxylase-like metal-dependent hydrolase (beta-lactamase superfamily II)
MLRSLGGRAELVDKPLVALATHIHYDLGDRHFEILHLPGHSTGSIGLWEARTGTLFSGDAIYDGPLLDDLPESDIPTYVETMKRLRGLPVDVVHGGHDESFGRERLIEIANGYIASRC